MKYENQVIVFPMGMRTNCNREKVGSFHHTFDTCKLSMANRRKTLKIGNAIRLNHLKEDTEFKNCRIFLEGIFTADKVIPYAIHECMIYVEKKTEELTIKKELEK